MTTHLSLQRMLLPTAQVSSLTTGSITLPSARGAFENTSFESIATATGTGSTGTVTFSSIPQDYKHLQVRWSAYTSSVGNGLLVRFNNNSGAVYHQNVAWATNAIARSQLAGNDSFNLAGSVAARGTDYPIVAILDIHNYNTSSNHKPILHFSGAADTSAVEVFLGSGYFGSTTAISSITIYQSGGNYTTNAVFALYGLR